MRHYGVNMSMGLTCYGEHQCWNAHVHSDLRRAVFDKQGELNYFPVPCPYMQSNTTPSGEKIMQMRENCPNGVDCKQAHTQTEILYHPLSFRTTQCTKDHSNPETRPKDSCPYFHSENDRRDVSQFQKFQYNQHFAEKN